MTKEKIFGLDVYCDTRENLIEDIDKNIQHNKKTFIVAINPEKVILANENSGIKKIINSATYQIPDGIGIVYASKFRKGKIKSRITGIDLMEKVCFLANEKKYKVYLYGAEKGVIKKTKENLENKYSQIKIVGITDGHYKDNKKLITKINLAKPDILFVALGSPKQEIWIYNNMNKIDAILFQGVGGSFDVFGGKTKRSPLIFRKLGLEWFYRLIKNPKRIGRQIRLIKFILLFFKKEKIK